MTFDAYATAWARLHGGVDPRTASFFVRGWVRLAYRGGSVLARLGLGPSAVTSLGLLFCLLVPAVAGLGPWGLLAGGLLVLLASFADGLDGAVAILRGKITKTGFVYDSVADRLGEAAWLLAFWLAGAPGPLVVGAGVISWLHEYLRARAAAGGMPEVGVITVGERPTRVAVACAGLIVAALAGFVRPDGPVALADRGLFIGDWHFGGFVPSALPELVLTVAVAVWAGLGVVGFGQLVRAVLNRLSGI